MARSLFQLPKVDPSQSVRIDTSAGSTSAADITHADGTSIAGSTLVADLVGALPAIYGPDGVSTLYLKKLTYKGAVTGSAVTLAGQGQAPAQPGVTSVDGKTGAVDLRATYVAPLSKTTTGAAAPLPFVNAADYGFLPTATAAANATALYNAIQAVAEGGAVVIPVGVNNGTVAYSITDLAGDINKSVKIMAIGTRRGGYDGSWPSSGCMLNYTGAGSYAFTIRPPDADQHRISVHLEGFQVQKAGIHVDGRAYGATCVDLTVEHVSTVQGTGHGWLIEGAVYEGRIRDVYSYGHAGWGISIATYVSGHPQVGEMDWDDLHLDYNGSGGFNLAGNGNHRIGRVSASRNTGSAFAASDTVRFSLDSLIAEANTGADVVTLTAITGSRIRRMQINYAPSFTYNGVHVLTSSQLNTIDGVTFTNTTTGHDIVTDNTTQNTLIQGYAGSGAGLSLAGTGDMVLAGGGLVSGTNTLTADGPTRTLMNLIGDPSQSADIWTYKVSGNTRARVTADGSLRSNHELIAEFGQGTKQTQIGDTGAGVGGMIVNGDTAITRGGAGYFAVPILVKNGVPSDADYAVTPPNGVFATNSAGAAGSRIYQRQAGSWVAIA